ncbi:MAG: adenylyltransferase/cytidyltransferase family protein [Patescibacteria group bacterium]
MNKTKVMLFGTFDGLHKGHISLFKQARKLAGNVFLIACIARDKNVFKIKNKKTVLLENKRKSLVKKCGLIDKVILGSLNNYLSQILKEKPNIIALGYDQKVFVKELKDYIKQKKLNIKIIKLKAYKKHIYKNSLLYISKFKRDK